MLVTTFPRTNLTYVDRADRPRASLQQVSPWTAVPTRQAQREDARRHAFGRAVRTPLMFILWNRLKHAEVAVYFTDRGIEELGGRRGEDQVTLGWLAARLQAFVDLHPDFDVPVDRLATWLARADDEDGDP